MAFMFIAVMLLASFGIIAFFGGIASWGLAWSVTPPRDVELAPIPAAPFGTFHIC